MSIEKKRKVWTQIIIMTIAIVMMIAIWPAKQIKHMIRSMPAEETTWVQKDFLSDDKLLQTFTPQCDYIKQIRLYLTGQNFSGADEITFVLYNSQYAPVFEKTYLCKDSMVQGYLDVQMDLSLVPGEVCYYEILTPKENKGSISVMLGDRLRMGQVENGMLFDGGKPDEVNAYHAEYVYIQPLSILRTIVYYIAILVVAGILYFGITSLWFQFPKSFEISGKCICIIAAIIVAGLMVVALYFAVYKNIFGGALLDQIIYSLGILSAGIWFGMLLFHKKPTYVESLASTSVIDMWRSYLQTLCFAGIIYANCMYANATEMKMQYENTRWMLICLGLAFITFIKVDFSKKKGRMEVITYLLWIGAGLCYAVKYVQRMTESMYLSKLYSAVIIIWGIVIIHTFFSLKKESVSIGHVQWLQWIQIIVTVAFTICMFINRYEKIWPFEILIPTILFLLLDLSDLEKGRIIRNLCNGILLAFVIVTGKALLYRPYMRWMFYRYPGYFHTVACTGMFLTVVVCASLVKFYIKAHGSEHILRDTWKELFFCGVSMIYVFLTMSRTALMAIAVLYICVIVLTLFLYKKSIKQAMIEIGLVLLITVCSFPMVYSATRMIPALINKPYRFDPVEPTVEEYSDMIVEGDLPDSDKYMNMERFMTLFMARIQLPEVLTVKEENTAEYEEVTEAYVQDTESDNDSEQEVDIARSDEAIAESDSTVEDENTFEVSKGITNGRMDIFKSYISAFNLSGHEKMGYQSLDGTKDYGHAHNSYIQVTYDFGIPAGILFLLLCMITFINAVYVTVKMGNRMEYALFVFGAVIIFGVVSLTEWAFHPSIPIGFVFIWSIGILLSISKRTKIQK